MTRPRLMIATLTPRAGGRAGATLAPGKPFKRLVDKASLKLFEDALGLSLASVGEAGPGPGHPAFTTTCPSLFSTYL